MKEQQVAIYARVSSASQVEEGTIESQLGALRSRVRSDGVSVDEGREFVDNGCSGATLARPALEQLRDEVAAGRVDVVYVHAPDRLARKYAYQVLLMEEWERAGAKVVFLHEPPEAGPEQTLLRQMQGMLAEYERAQILERSRRGKRHKARCGDVSVFSSAPYGYRYITKAEGNGTARWEIMEDQARVVRQIFEWVGVERMTINGVCRRLARSGVRAPCRAYVGRMLTNPAYMGKAAFGRSRQGSPVRVNRAPPGQPEIPRRGSLTRPTERDRWIFVPVPALVSEELFDAVQEQMEENKRRVRARRGRRRFLQGLLVCGHCGYAYSGRKWRGVQYYACNSEAVNRRAGAVICTNRSVRGERLDEAVWQEVRGLLEEPSRIETEYQRRLDADGPDHEARELADLKRRLQVLERAHERLLDGYTEGFIAKAEAEPRIRGLKERRTELEREMEQARNRQDRIRELRVVTGRLADFADQVKGGLESCDGETRKELVRTLVKRVEIYDKEVNVVFRVGAPPFEPGPRTRGQHCLQRVGVSVRVGGTQGASEPFRGPGARDRGQ